MTEEIYKDPMDSIGPAMMKFFGNVGYVGATIWFGVSAFGSMVPETGFWGNVALFYFTLVAVNVVFVSILGIAKMLGHEDWKTGYPVVWAGTMVLMVMPGIKPFEKKAVVVEQPREEVKKERPVYPY